MVAPRRIPVQVPMEVPWSCRCGFACPGLASGPCVSTINDREEHAHFRTSGRNEDDLRHRHSGGHGVPAGRRSGRTTCDSVAAELLPRPRRLRGIRRPAHEDECTAVGIQHRLRRRLRGPATQPSRPGSRSSTTAAPGESTRTFVDGRCSGRGDVKGLHDPFKGAQLDAALAFLRAHPGRVSPITLTLWGTTSSRSLTPARATSAASRPVLHAPSPSWVPAWRRSSSSCGQPRRTRRSSSPEPGTSTSTPSPDRPAVPLGRHDDRTGGRRRQGA